MRLALLLLAAVVSAGEDLPDPDTLWDYAKPAETEKRFREVLARASLSRDRDYALQLRTQIARALGLQGKFEEALEELDAVERARGEAALARPTGAGLPAVRIRCLLERGRVYNSWKQPEKARPLFLDAWELGLEKGLDRHAVDAAHMMALLETEPAERLAWSRKAMELAEASPDEKAKRWLGALYNNMGWDAHDRGDFAEALRLHGKCLAWHEARDPGSAGTRTAKWSVARQLRALGRADEALARQRSLLEEYAAVGEEDGFVYEEIGECLLALGKRAEAKPWFRKALARLRDIDWVRGDKARLDRLRELAAE
jgi:tetratricopeptide (TPR) repeat protein